MTDGEPRGDGCGAVGIGDAMAAESGETEAAADTTTAADALPLGPLGRLLAFAGREYRVVFRSRWTLGITVVTALFAVGVLTVSTGGVGSSRPAAVVITLAELSVYFVPLVALALGHGTVVDADERGTLELLLALPVPRRDVIVGATLGRAFALVGALALGFGAGAVVVVRSMGLAPLGLYLTLAGGVLWLGLVFLGLGVLTSTVAPEKSHALGGALVVWAWFVLVHDLVALGLAVAFDLSRGALTALVLANPVDVFRLVVLASTGVSNGGSAAALVVESLGTGPLVAALLAWAVVPALAAGRLIERRSV